MRCTVRSTDERERTGRDDASGRGGLRSMRHYIWPITYLVQQWCDELGICPSKRIVGEQKKRIYYAIHITEKEALRREAEAIRIYTRILYHVAICGISADDPIINIHSHEDPSASGSVA